MKTPAPIANAVHVIFPYRHPENRALWVFDDARFGLVQEPFVLGASEAIERLATEKLGAVDRVKVIFSAKPLPNPDRILRRVWNGDAPDVNGCQYNDGTADLWLCPAMTYYLAGPIAPESIYLKAEAA